MTRGFLLIVAGIVAFSVASGAVGAGIAAADPNLKGQTYSKAAELIASWGSKAVISSVVGDQLAMDDCIVTASKNSKFLDSSGRHQSPAVLLNLNCNPPLASAGKPGASAATPEGRKIKKDLGYLTWMNRNPSTNCADKNLDWCKQLCDKYGDSCPTGLQQYLASV